MDVGIAGIVGWAASLIAFFAVVLVLFVVFVRAARFAVGGPGSGRVRREVVSGVELLDERLALGEITREEYDIARRALGR
jgi:uncharacterized membrane protein